MYQWAPTTYGYKALNISYKLCWTVRDSGKMVDRSLSSITTKTQQLLPVLPSARGGTTVVVTFTERRSFATTGGLDLGPTGKGETEKGYQVLQHAVMMECSKRSWEPSPTVFVTTTWMTVLARMGGSIANAKRDGPIDRGDRGTTQRLVG
jgi:hypothetical protein